MSPTEQQQQYQAWAAYYAQNPQADPYAAYGGYAAMMAQYMQNPAYYQQQTAQSQSPAGQNGAAPPPPPPPDDGNLPPPPPPGGAGQGGYNQVSPNIRELEKFRICLTFRDKVPPPPGI